MELSRHEYPAMLGALSPGQAVATLNERIKHISRLNSDIADWLQERRRIEEAYVQGLHKLSRRQPPDEGSDLGVFATPWQKIVSSTESLAESHHILAQKIEADVERPLREFATTNREMQAMSTISGNLASMAKDVESAQKKADKLKDRGAKAVAGKVANASSDVDNAQSQWDSQAPYVFEKFQAVDESRLNHLRDVLTQFQTHEVDQVERNRVNAEQCLNVLLNVETADEIRNFKLRTLSGRPQMERQRSSRNTMPSPGPSSSLAPTTPTLNVEDGSSQRSASGQNKGHGGLSGLKRLGTVLGRRRQSAQPLGRGMSPERKNSSSTGSAFGSFGGKASRSRDMPPPMELQEPTSPARRRPEGRFQQAVQPVDSPPSPKQSRRSAERPNGTIVETISEPLTSSGVVNGAPPASVPQLQEPLQPSTPTIAHPEPQKDPEGFSVPPSAPDAISQAEQEAALSSESPAPQFKVDIRNAPIEEEDGDANAALANVANTLRAQAAPPRKPGINRGRRDVRNTIFVPTPQPTESAGVEPLSSVSQTASPTAAAPISLPASPPAAPPHSPFRASHRATLLTDDHTASDTQSVRSGRSLSSSTSALIKHPELHEPGLSSSVVETVSAWFEHGNVSKAVVIGELALAFNPVDLSAPSGTENIRLENFHVLEKVAPNPTFIDQVPNKPGSYTLDLAGITKTTVAFKYQVHLDETIRASHAPILLNPAWKVEPTQTSVIFSYSLNPAFAMGSRTSVTISNVVLILHVDGAKATSCQSKPVGTFSKEKSLIYWRLGDITLAPDQPAQQLRARFFTEREAKPGNVEARWEIVGENVLGLGSRLSVSQLIQGSELGKTEGPVAEGADPFADEGSAASTAPTPTAVWREVTTVRKIGSGTYVAS